mgnify:CR=1 FL=1
MSELKIEDVKTIEQAKERISELIDQIGNIGVESRFYEIAFLSRWRDNSFSCLNAQDYHRA